MALIRLQFSRQRDLSSELIAWFSHGAGFTHVDTVAENGWLLGARDEVCAGIAPGVQLRPPNYAAFERVLILDLGCDDAIARAYGKFVADQIGKPYDMRAIAGFATGRDWRDPGAWYCSELNTAGLEASGFFQWKLTTPASKVDPDDLLLALSVRTEVRLP
jgi:hypothetical protein